MTLQCSMLSGQETFIVMLLSYSRHGKGQTVYSLVMSVSNCNVVIFLQ